MIPSPPPIPSQQHIHTSLLHRIKTTRDSRVLLTFLCLFVKHILHMEQKPLLQLLVVLLGLSHLLFFAAAAPPRFLMSGTSFREMVAQEHMHMNRGVHMAEGFVHGRMEIQTNDYSGSGANNRHDPKTPERS